MGYAGVVGLESFASGDPDAALAAFRAAFARGAIERSYAQL